MFVLATTDPRRSLPTIRSRTQHFEFTLYTVDEIPGHLADVLRAGRRRASTRRARRSSRVRAAGSMRDALSLLDQAIAHGALDVEQVSALFGGTAFELRMRVLRAWPTRTSPA